MGIDRRGVSGRNGGLGAELFRFFLHPPPGPRWRGFAGFLRLREGGAAGVCIFGGGLGSGL